MLEPRAGSISVVTAASLTVANMIGTGVFTSLGFQLADIRSGFALVMLWVVGGVFALCGALAYGELAAALPRSGGELHFLGRVYHPSLGFLAGWVSITVGFAAPIALAAMAFGGYAARVTGDRVAPVVLSCAAVVAVTAAHLWNLRLSSVVQNLLTLFKVALILVFVVAALAVAPAATATRFAPQAADLGVMLSGPWAIALLFVMYAYAGWNAAAYVAGEVARPAVAVPRALVSGTAIVLVLYVALNAVFLLTTPQDAMRGQLEVGHVVAAHLFGDGGGRLMSSLLAIALVSSVSAMVWAGPRVIQILGEDYPLFRPLGSTNRHGIPVVAVVAQSAIVLTMILTSTFEVVLVYVQVVLTLSSALTVAGVFVLRRREPDLPRPYRTWGYPWTPLLFLAISAFAVAHAFVTEPARSVAGLLTVAAGYPVYLLARRGARAAGAAG